MEGGFNSHAEKLCLRVNFKHVGSNQVAHRRCPSCEHRKKHQKLFHLFFIMENSSTLQIKDEAPENVPLTVKNWRFHLILASLSFLCFVASLDGSIIATALPKITSELSAANDYVWIANSFLVAQTVVQPLCAQLCNIFGRRMPMIISILIFALGSGISGGANESSMLIAGRTVQGLGSGGIMVLVELIVCDLVPLRERGKYLGIVLSSSAVGAIIGPVVSSTLPRYREMLRRRTDFILSDWWCFSRGKLEMDILLERSLFRNHHDHHGRISSSSTRKGKNMVTSTFAN